MVLVHSPPERQPLSQSTAENRQDESENDTASKLGWHHEQIRQYTQPSQSPRPPHRHQRDQQSPFKPNKKRGGVAETRPFQETGSEPSSAFNGMTSNTLEAPVHGGVSLVYPSSARKADEASTRMTKNSAFFQVNADTSKLAASPVRQKQAQPVNSMGPPPAPGTPQYKPPPSAIRRLREINASPAPSFLFDPECDDDDEASLSSLGSSFSLTPAKKTPGKHHRRSGSSVTKQQAYPALTPHNGDTTSASSVTSESTTSTTLTVTEKREEVVVETMEEAEEQSWKADGMGFEELKLRQSMNNELHTLLAHEEARTTLLRQLVSSQKELVRMSDANNECFALLRERDMTIERLTLERSGQQRVESNAQAELLRARLQEAEGSLALAEERVNSTRDQLIDVKEELGVSKKQTREQREARDELEQALSAEREQKEEMQAKLLEECEATRRLRLELSALKEKLTESQEGEAQKGEAAQEHLNELQTQNQWLQEEKNQAIEAMNQAQSMASEATDSLEREIEARERLEQELYQTREQIVQLQAEHCEELRQAVLSKEDEVSVNNDAARQRLVDSYEDTLSDLRSTLSVTQHENSELRSRMVEEQLKMEATLKDQCSQLGSTDEALREKQSELEIVTRALSESRAALQHSEGRTAQLEESITALKAEAERVNEESRGELKDALRRHRQDRERWEGERQTLIEEFDRHSQQTLNELTGQVEELVRAVSDRDAIIATLSGQARQAEEEKEMLQTSYDQVVRTVEKKEELVLSLSEAIREYKEEHAGEVKLLRSKCRELEKVNDEHSDSVAHYEEAINSLQLLRKKLHNELVEARGNIRVFCRVRPDTVAHDVTSTVDDDRQEGGVRVVKDRAGVSGECVDLSIRTPSSDGTTTRDKNWSFAFDRVFEKPTSQSEVFEEVEPLVQSALDGFPLCIFAYGQTGSGKTWSMLGDCADESQGIVYRAVEKLFTELSGKNYSISIEAVEIYNETVRDLLPLDDGSKKGASLNIRRDTVQGKMATFVEGVSAHQVSDSSTARTLLDRALASRATKATQCNDVSSRSHCVMSIRFRPNDDGDEAAAKAGVMHFCDLAGSERLSRSKSNENPELLKETQAINKSLSALGNTMSALVQGHRHVPFRDSKLTYLLQDCFLSDSKCLLLCTLAPKSINETLGSLRFAETVSKVTKESRQRCRKCGECLLPAAAAASQASAVSHHSGGRTLTLKAEDRKRSSSVSVTSSSTLHQSKSFTATTQSSSTARHEMRAVRSFR